MGHQLLFVRVHKRNEERKNKASNAAALKQANGKNVGYVPRNQMPSTLTASGFTSTSMAGNGGGEEELDPESAAGLAKLRATDEEINSGLDAIGKTIDNLGQIAATMKDEVSRNHSYSVVKAKLSLFFYLLPCTSYHIFLF